MALRYSLPFVAVALALLAWTLHTPTSPAARPAAEIAVAPLVEAVAAPLPAGAPGLGLDSPLYPLLAFQDRNQYQRGNVLPPGWKAERPLNLSGAMPTDEELRAAVLEACDYVLSLQNENGGWDVILSGNLLSQTADEAVDAICVTSMSGIALRYHLAANPPKFGAAIDRAADFVMDRIIRGKLPTKVRYANWRYTLALKFLNGEFINAEDEDRKKRIASVCRRCIQALLNMQLSNNPAPLLERKRKARLSSRAKKLAAPSRLGVVLALPTDEDYRGGARIVAVEPGSAAEKVGLKVGDRIVQCERLTVDNAIDFYTLEPTWIGGQKIEFYIKRDGGKRIKKVTQLPFSWPAYLGLKVSEGMGNGPTIESFLRFSPCKGELELGDVLVEVNKVKITKLADFLEVEKTIQAGKKVRIKIRRGKRKKSYTILAAPAPEGMLGFTIDAEDKGDLNGVLVGGVRQGSSAEEMGLEEGDRVTWIGPIPVAGVDHFIDLMGIIPAGRELTVKWIRSGEEMSAKCTPAPILVSGDPQFKWNTVRGVWGRALIGEVKKGGVAAKAGIRKGDEVLAVNGVKARMLYEAYSLLSRVPAGDEVTLELKSRGKTKEIKFTLAKPDASSGPEQEEGGWAYYPSMRESPSFSTAAALLALYDVQKNLKLKVPKARIKAAELLVNSLRVKDPHNGGVETYMYREGSRGHAGGIGMDLRGSMGRNAICDLTLVRARYVKRSKGHLKKTLNLWMQHRHEMDRVRHMTLYMGSPHNRDLYFNAAYYWLFGTYHTMMAANYVGGSTQKKINEIATKSIMLVRKENGLWVGHAAFGELCGTTLALWILGETTGPWKENWPPVTQEEKDKENNPKTSDPDDS